MNLPRLSANRPVGVGMLYVCIAVLGLVAARQLAVDLMPEVDMPRISVTTTYEGVAPEEMETLITRPVEQALATVTGLDQLNSMSAEGMSSIQAQFDWGIDLNEVVNDIREQLDFVRGNLPEDASAPTLFKFNLSDMPVVFLGLSGEGDARQIRHLAEETISRRLERLPGVAAVDIQGGRVREIQVQLAADRMAALGITPSEVTMALSRENRNVSAGDMLETGREVLIRTIGEFERTVDVENTIVAIRDGRPILVRDVGRVEDGIREMTNELLINGAPGMRMFVQKQSGSNTVEVVDRLKREIDAINRDYAGRAEISILMDSAAFIRQAVNNVQRGAIFGAALAILVLFFFLRDLRATLIVGAAIPISVLATIALMYFNGFTLNVISLAGIALGIGMLVDGSIVVLESIYRRLHEGERPTAAAIAGSNEVAMAIAAGTLTTVAVFLPVVFISGFAGIFFNQLAITVSFALLCALFVALTLIPAAAARWLRRVPANRRTDDERVAALGPVDLAYGRMIEWALGRPGLVMASAVVLLFGSFTLVPVIGLELMPESDEGRLNMQVEMPVGSPLEVTTSTMAEIEARVRGAVRPEELDNLLTTAGPESWWRPAQSNQGTMEILLTPITERSRGQEEIVASIRRAIADVPAADIELYASSSNMMMRMMRGGQDARLVVEIRGHDLDQGNELAPRVIDAMAAVPGVVHPRLDREAGQLERTLRVDRARLAELGLSGSQVADAVEHYVLGRVATRFRDQGDEFDIRVQLRPEDRLRLEQLPQLPIVTPYGDVVRLGSIASIDPGEGPLSINRENQQRMMQVLAGIDGRRFSDVANDVEAALARVETPYGFTIDMGGELEEQRQVFLELVIGVLLAVFLVYTVMAVQFESLVQPLVIMTAVPFSLLGVLLTLALTGTTLNMNSFLGLVVLVGIVVNNAIVLVDNVNRMRREVGCTLHEALIRGARRRLRPILMTTLTTALGLLPLTLGIGEGSELQAPLARVVVGGLLASTLITLIFVPSLYLLVERGRERSRAIRGRRKAARSAGMDVPHAAPAMQRSRVQA